MPSGDTTSATIARRLHRDWLILLWSLAVVPAIAGLTWPRSAFQPDAPWDKWQKLLLESDAYLGHLAGRFCTGLSFAAIFYILVRYWPRNGLPNTGRTLWLGTIGVGVSFIVAAVMGTVPSFLIGCLGVPLLGTAIFLLPCPDYSWLTAQLASICRLYVYGSIVAALVAFGWTVEYPYELAYLQSFPYRLHGITINQSNLGLLALLLVFVRLYAPHRSVNFLGCLDVVFALLVILTAQSKVSIGLALIFLPWGIIHQFAIPVQKLSRHLCAIVFLGSLLFVGLAGSINENGALAAWRDVDPHLDSLTGRTDIWDVSLALWQQNPLFGYGNDLWGNEMSAAYATRLGWAPGQAHSQFVQGLAQTGLIGFTLMVFYFVALSAASVSAFSYTSALSVVLVGTLLLRGATESWIRSFVTDGNFLAHALVLSVVVCGIRSNQRVSTTDNEPTPLP